MGNQEKFVMINTLIRQEKYVFYILILPSPVFRIACPRKKRRKNTNILFYLTIYMYELRRVFIFIIE